MVNDEQGHEPRLNDRPIPPSASASSPSVSAPVSYPGFDALLLAVLVFAVLQITGLAESVALPNRLQDVLNHPLLGNILPESGEQAMGEIGPRPGEPLGLLLNALTLGALLAYLLVDLGSKRRSGENPPNHARWKWFLLSVILLTALFLPTSKLILLRQQSGPASYTHDGGVIQTEVTIQYLLTGKNPYQEDYVDTPMAEWGFSKYRTALYHYPYLPWTFLFSAPFYLLGQSLGFYDQRWVYLLLMAVALVLARHLAGPATRSRLALVALLGLNPIMTLDLIFGQNDAFVLCWLIFSLAAWQHWRMGQLHGVPHHNPHRWAYWLSTLCFGLACASKPTAWFFAPFYGLLLIYDEWGGEERGKEVYAETKSPFILLLRAVPRIVWRGLPAFLTFLVVMLPYLLWDPAALYDDVWRWSSGQGETGYQIWGWGGSNFVLALGLVTDRFALWPFWLVEVVLALPLLLWFLHRQVRSNTLANACWHYAIFMLAFFYGSRFLNENYLGYILAFLALGYFARHLDSRYLPDSCISYSVSGGSTPMSETVKNS